MLCLRIPELNLALCPLHSSRVAVVSGVPTRINIKKESEAKQFPGLKGRFNARTL